MMLANTVCRVCLVNDLNLYSVRNELQNAYEIITRQKYNKVGYPVSMCYICLSVLRKCHRFMETARDANKFLTRWYKQKNEIPVTQPLSTYSTTKIELVSANEDISSEHDIKQENEDLAEQLAGDIETEYTECNIAIDTEKTDVDEPTDDSTMLVDSSTVTAYNDTTQVCDDKQTDPLFNTNVDNEWSGLDMVSQQNNGNPQICQIIEVKSETETKEEIQVSRAREIPEHLIQIQIEMDDTHEVDADDVCHTDNFNIKFNSKSKILKTKTTQSGKRLHICKVCDRSWTSGAGFKRHVVLEHSTEKNIKKPSTTNKKKKIFSCSVCSYKCTQQSHLTRHMRYHTGEKLYSCDICVYKFTRKVHLADHMKTHTGEKPFLCDICDYKCTLKSNLTRHLRTHTGERPFSCDICDYKCIQKSTLTLHIRTHTGEKPFCCNICNYKCAYKRDLTHHFRTHTGEKPFSCDICNYKCTQKSALTTHKRTHTGEKPFSCNICDYECAQKTNLKKHLVRKHMHNTEIGS